MKRILSRSNLAFPNPAKPDVTMSGNLHNPYSQEIQFLVIDQVSRLIGCWRQLLA